MREVLKDGQMKEVRTDGGIGRTDRRADERADGIRTDRRMVERLEERQDSWIIEDNAPFLGIITGIEGCHPTLNY